MPSYFNFASLEKKVDIIIHYFKNVTKLDNLTDLYLNEMIWWPHKGEFATLRGKISKKMYLKSLKKHEIKRTIICFTYKIEIYFIRKHQLFYFYSWLRQSSKYCIWCSLSEIIFQSTCKTTEPLRWHCPHFFPGT
jgi:hypothetical protein